MTAPTKPPTISPNKKHAMRLALLANPNLKEILYGEALRGSKHYIDTIARDINNLVEAISKDAEKRE